MNKIWCPVKELFAEANAGGMASVSIKKKAARKQGRYIQLESIALAYARASAFGLEAFLSDPLQRDLNQPG